MTEASRLSLSDTYRSTTLLLTGASGFVGKVTLATLLAKLPDVRRIYVLMRPKRGKSAITRFEEDVMTSHCLAPLHEAHGAELAAFIGRRVRVVEGDVAWPDLGLGERDLAALRAELDLVINCAGNVEFNPPLEDAVASNVDGALNVAALVRSCEKAALLHVSTCYVAGRRNGRIREPVGFDVSPDISPDGQPFDGPAEVDVLQAVLAEVRGEVMRAEVAADIDARLSEGLGKRGLDPHDPELRRQWRPRYERRWLKDRMTAVGTERAESWGWRNTYTYTKGIAEAVLTGAAQRGELPLALVRPAIVESALRFPFPGWNEGYNTSGPIVHLLGTWFRLYPAKASLAFDVVPVDLVVNVLLTAGAALLRREHRPVYQAATSVRNLFTMGRATELSALGHRRHLRRHGKTALDRRLRSRWDAVNVDLDHPARLENVVKVTTLVGSLAERLERAALPARWREKVGTLAAMARNSGYVLAQADRMLNAFRPFIFDDHFEFEASAIRAHPLTDADRAADLEFDPESIDWRRYWVDIHMPGLRRWVWPELEGKEIERYRPATPFRYVALDEAATPSDAVASVAYPPESAQAARAEG